MIPIPPPSVRIGLWFVLATSAWTLIATNTAMLDHGPIGPPEPPLIEFTFAPGTPLVEMLESLAARGNIGIVVSPCFRESCGLRLRARTATQAIVMVAAAHGYSVERDFDLHGRPMLLVMQAGYKVIRCSFGVPVNPEPPRTNEKIGFILDATSPSQVAYWKRAIDQSQHVHPTPDHTARNELLNAYRQKLARDAARAGNG